MDQGKAKMTPLEQRAAALLRRLPAGRVRAVEVGVLRGKLSALLLAARPELVLWMVDNWQGVEDQPESYKATRDDHALADAARASLHKADAIGVSAAYPGRAPVLHMSSIEAAELCGDHSLDLVFLDADHSEEGVAADLAAWASKVKPGGWIGGHDYGNNDPRFDFSGVKRAVDRVFPAVELDLNFTWWQRIEGASHG